MQFSLPQFSVCEDSPLQKFDGQFLVLVLSPLTHVLEQPTYHNQGTNRTENMILLVEIILKIA